MLDILIRWIVGEKHTPGETFGGRGMVYSWSGKASHLTAGIKKEAQIFQASLFGFSTSRMAVSSTQQCGMSNWQACQSSHTLMFLIEGSGR